jgi:hypothetical protein
MRFGSACASHLDTRHPPSHPHHIDHTHGNARWTRLGANFSRYGCPVDNNAHGNERSAATLALGDTGAATTSRDRRAARPGRVNAAHHRPDSDDRASARNDRTLACSDGRSHRYGLSNPRPGDRHHHR